MLAAVGVQFTASFIALLMSQLTSCWASGYTSTSSSNTTNTMERVVAVFKRSSTVLNCLSREEVRKDLLMCVCSLAFIDHHQAQSDFQISGDT